MPSIPDDDDSMNEKEENEFAMLVRKVEKNLLQEKKNKQLPEIKNIRKK